MIGTVTPHNEVVISVRFRGTNGEVAIPLVLDTGFDDYVALTPETIEALGLKEHDVTYYMTADGQRISSKYHVGLVEWFGVWKRIPVIRIEGGTLLGLAMLSGCRVTMDVVEGGEVSIQQLPH